MPYKLPGDFYPQAYNFYGITDREHLIKRYGKNTALARIMQRRIDKLERLLYYNYIMGANDCTNERKNAVSEKEES